MANPENKFEHLTYNEVHALMLHHLTLLYPHNTDRIAELAAELQKRKKEGF